MKENKKFLGIYAIIIIILLIAILFLIPDDVFMLKYKNLDLPEDLPKVEEKEFVDFEIQKEQLLSSNYDYKYLILDSMGKQTYKYKCSGSIIDNKEIGTCTSPEDFSYTETNKKDLFKISLEYLDIKNIYKLIEKENPIINKYPITREFRYTTMIEDLETDIVIYTNIENITRIDINNAYMTYVIEYDNYKN